MRKSSIVPFTIFVLAPLALAAGCADEHTADPGNDAGIFVGTPAGDGGGTSDGDDGSASKLDAPVAVLAPPAPVGLAVVTSDFSINSISVLSAAGELVRAACIDSNTGLGGQLSLALSNDVTLPSQPQLGNEIWVVDRGNSDLTVVDPASCAVKRQLSVSTGFKSNPHDVARVSDSKAYVTRFEKNLLPTNVNSGGDDILIIDPRAGAIAGRINLASYASPVAGFTTQARPDRAVIAGGRVVVTLASQDALFKVSGDGRVVVLDPATDQVTDVVPIPGMQSCSAMDVLPGSSTVFVACSGTFGDVNQALHSGVALIDLGVQPPVVRQVISSQVFGSRPVNFSWVLALTPTRAFAGTLGAFPNQAGTTPALPDGVFAFDPTTGHTAQVVMAGAFDLGRAAGGGGRLFVPDATFSAPRIHVFDGAVEATQTESRAFDADPPRGLPPREIAWY